MRKKLFSLALALVMCLSLVPVALATETRDTPAKFTDVPADAYYWDELDYALYNNFISGTSVSMFSPDAPVTRAQFVTILGRMLNVQTSMYTSSKFEDVDMSSWYGSFVAWAAELGIVSGVDSRHFSPNSNITVEQMAVMMNNCISKLSMSPKEAPVTYKDMSRVSTWAVSGMETAAQYNLLPTDASGNVSPRRSATRAEATVALVRLAKSTGLGEEPTIIPSTTETPSTGGSSSGTENPMPFDEAKAVAEGLHDEFWASGKITSSMTEKEKAIVYYDWMITNCEYGHGSEDGMEHNPYGALVNKVAVCDGLAYAYWLFMQTEGIRCECIPVRERNHMYNNVTLDGTVYRVDISHDIAYAKALDGSVDQELVEMYRDKTFMSPQEFRDKWYGPQCED